MFAYSSLKTSFPTNMADLAAQYHLQKQDLTRCFFFLQVSIPMASDPRKKKNRRGFSFLLKSAMCENLGHNRQDAILFNTRKK
jgi:hypothetical protein